jgi:hypothetical protein
MPARLIYASSNDVPRLNDVLKSLGSLALLETHDGHNWRANRDFELEGAGRWPFWCFSGGSLMLLPADPFDEPSIEIENPYSGWFQVRGSKEEPYFANQTNIIYLNINTAPRLQGSHLGLSSIEWIGNYFACAGRVASASMKSEWSRIGRALNKATTKVPRGGMASGDRKMVAAFPGALAVLSDKNAIADVYSR